MGGGIPSLQRLGDTDLVLEDPAADVRGRAVVDREGADVGEVDELIVDADEAKVRFLAVGAGGVLGVGERTLLVPVDAVTRVDPDAVRVDQTRDRLREAPGYDPELTVAPEDFEDIYGYYGYRPFWTRGYVYPGYPQITR